MHKELAQKMGASHAGKDELCVPPLPTQSATPRPVFLQHGRGVRKAAACGTDFLHQPPEALAHHKMIVLPLGIHADAGGLAQGTVGQSHADDRPHSGHKGIRVVAQALVALQIAHSGMASAGNPTAVTLPHHSGQGKGRRQSASNKAKAPSLGFDCFAIQTPGIHILVVRATAMPWEGRF